MRELIPFNEKSNRFLNPQDVFNDFGDFIEDFFAPKWNLHFDPKTTTFKIDVKETDNAYVIEAELPGVKKEDINIDINKQTLRISVNHKTQCNTSSNGYIHRERCTSSMSRSIRLADAQLNDIKAKLDQGILYITVAKCCTEKDNVRKIEIE